MTTDKTLADAKPGGCVQLATAPERCAECRHTTFQLHPDGHICVHCKLIVAAQPSPGGQGDASHYWPEVDRILVNAYVAGSEGDELDMIAARNAIHAALAARQPVGTAPQGCDACDRTGIRQNDEGRNICCPDCDLGRACAGDTRQPVGEPVAWKYRAPVVSFWRVSFHKPVNPEWECEPLYAAPPRRPWTLAR